MKRTEVAEKYRLGLLRFLNRKDDAWSLFGVMLIVASEDRMLTSAEVEWFHVGRREAFALGEIQQREHWQGLEVRITEKGRRTLALEEALR